MESEQFSGSQPVIKAEMFGKESNPAPSGNLSGGPSQHARAALGGEQPSPTAFAPTSSCLLHWDRGNQTLHRAGLQALDPVRPPSGRKVSEAPGSGWRCCRQAAVGFTSLLPALNHSPGQRRCEEITNPCHSERSEESAFVCFQRDKCRFFASLRMTGRWRPSTVRYSSESASGTAWSALPNPVSE